MTEGWRWGRRSLRPVSREALFVSRVSCLREGQDMRERRDLSRQPPPIRRAFRATPASPAGYASRTTSDEHCHKGAGAVAEDLFTTNVGQER